MSLAYKRFEFDRVFGNSPLGTASNPVALELRIEQLEAELARMRSEHEAALATAEAEAFQRGLDQARGEREIAVLAALDALHAGIEDVDARFGALEHRLTREAADLALAAADLLAGRALADAPAAAIDEAISRTLAQVRRGTALRVRVHPDLVETMERLVVERQSHERRKLTILVFGDAGIALGDALIGWDEGGLALEREARLRTIRDEIDSLLG